MMPRFSVIVATSGRPTLSRALQSLADQPLQDGDEVIVTGAGADIQQTAEAFGYRYLGAGPFGCWGQRERHEAMAYATGTHLVFLDDDDIYAPGAFAAMRAVCADHPDCPVMFRMIAPWGETLWRRPIVYEGNLGGPQFVTPNDPARLGAWGLRYEGDFDFIVSTLARYPQGALVWDQTVTYICRPPTEAVA